MEWRIDNIFVFALSVSTLFSLAFIPTIYLLDAFAATSFGTNYRHLTTLSPGATADTTTTVTVASSTTGTFIVNPYTSGSTATGTPSTTSLNGYGWRTAGVVGSSIPAGAWSFTVTTQTSLTSLLGNGKVKVYAYSTDTLGSNLSFIGSAEGTSNVFAILTAQTETITFSVGSVDLTNRVLVVEYWIDVTTGPLLATTITFQAASSTQTVVLPSSSGTFYLGKSSLFSAGESESAAVLDALSRSLIMARVPTDSLGITDTNLSRNIDAHRNATEVSGAGITDSISKFTSFTRQVSETSGAVVSDSISKFIGYARQLTETSGALIGDGISRESVIARMVIETSISMSDFLDAILNALNPPSSTDEDEGKNRGGGREIPRNLTFDPSYFLDNPLERVICVNVVILNSDDVQFASILEDEEVRIVCSLLNQQTVAQEYVLVIQIVDGQNIAHHISLSRGSLEKGQNVKISQYWSANLESNYEVQLMVLDGIDNSPVLLAEKTSKELVVIKR